MKTRKLVALLEEKVEDEIWPETVILSFDAKKLKARVKFLPSPEWLSAKEQLVRLELTQEADLFWKQSIKIQRGGEAHFLASGYIIDPAPETSDKKDQEAKRLKMLAGDVQDMIMVLLRSRGLKGLREKEIVDFCGLESEKLMKLLPEMEQKGLIKILGWRPFLLISRDSLDFLSEQIVAFLKRYHQKHPEALGVSKDKLKKRFRLPRLTLALSLALLKKENKIVIHENNQISLSFHEIPLSEEESKILAQLEELCYRGEFRRVSFEELRNRFRLSHRALEKLLGHLVARKKIFQSANGFYLHSYWLEEIIQRLRQSGKKELTIADFKAMTGLSRKYAIPLLELLDKMGITRRKGSSREIL
ncbi:MAG: SelB C-terminal domain-containing protein [Candidatus Aminicenantes bacterium]|nr:SelB C-terminal domain-containing protein [Candidatus Aminicenantes bacterium]